MTNKTRDWHRKWDAGNYSTEAHARELRAALVDADVYPPSQVDDTADDGYIEATRATLPEILDVLDATDVLAIYNAARLLAIVERDEEVFKRSARQTCRALARGGIDPGEWYDLQELGIAEQIGILLAPSG